MIEKLICAVIIAVLWIMVFDALRDVVESVIYLIENLKYIRPEGYIVMAELIRYMVPNIVRMRFIP